MKGIVTEEPLALNVTIIGLNYSPELTGIAPYTTRLAESLAASGMRVNVITGYPHYPEWRLKDGYSGLKMVETAGGVRITRYRHFIPRRVTAIGRVLLETSFGLRVVIARWPVADVVLLVTPALLSNIPALIRLQYGLRRPPVAVWVQDLYTKGLEEMRGENAGRVRMMKSLESFVLRSATGVTVIHERFKSFISNQLGVDAQSIEVIRNWTHTRSDMEVDRIATRERLGWDPDEIIALHAGNMGEKQALENVVEAAVLAGIRRAPIRFVLLGDGNQRNRIERMATGVSNLELRDPLPDTEFNAVLRSADILLVNEKRGLKETAVPSKLTTYFAAGLPVIAATEADSTTANEIDSSGAGIRVEPENPRELIAAIEQLRTDVAGRKAYGDAGRHYARVSLSEEAAVSAYTKWLTSMAMGAREVSNQTEPAQGANSDHEDTEQGDLR